MNTADARQITVRNRSARDTLHRAGVASANQVRQGMYDQTGIRYTMDDVNAALADLIHDGMARRDAPVEDGVSLYTLTLRGTQFAAAAIEVEEAAEASVDQRDDERATANAVWLRSTGEVEALRSLRRKATGRGESGEGLVIDGLLESALVRRCDAEAALTAAANALNLAQAHLAAVRVG